MTVRVRIAPSPTGNLHIGTARTAVFNWLFARRHSGQFVLRIEDTDVERSRPEFTQNILDGLQWLGLDWDEGPFFQSQRAELYRQTVQTLLDKGMAYPCYCTAEELKAMRESQKARKQAPRYDNRHRNLTAGQRTDFESQGRQPVIRFIIDDEREIVWDDQIRGRLSWQGRDLGGDMVIARRGEGDAAFGVPLYNLAVVADDIDMGITHVIRGEDHIANTAKQILLYEALGASVPTFAHSPLILNPKGQKLSKRDGATSVWDFKEMGFLPVAIANYMSLLGWTPPDATQEIFTLDEAAQQFDLNRVSKAGAKFDWAKLDWLNGQYLRALPTEELLDLLIPYWQAAGYELDAVGDRPWLLQVTELSAPGLNRLPDGVEAARLLFGDSIHPDAKGLAHLQQDGVADILHAVFEALPSESELSEADAKGIIKQVTDARGVKKGLVMKSLRAGLMGELQGPDLVQSWQLLHQRGWDRARLQQAIQHAR